MKSKSEAHKIRNRMVENGLLEVRTEEKNGRPVELFKNRTLKEALEWQLATKKKIKKDIIQELTKRLNSCPGAKEKAKLANLLEYFSKK